MDNQNSTRYGALLLRVSLGSVFLAHGLLKVLVFTPAGTVGFFGSLGLPAWLAYATMAAEIFGGLLLICLLYTSPSPRDKRQSRMPSSA